MNGAANNFSSGFGGSGGCTGMGTMGVGGGYGYANPAFGGYAAQTPLAGFAQGAGANGAAAANANANAGVVPAPVGSAPVPEAPPRIVPLAVRQQAVDSRPIRRSIRPFSRC